MSDWTGVTCQECQGDFMVRDQELELIENCPFCGCEIQCEEPSDA